jgi:hypothetical protein
MAAVHPTPLSIQRCISSLCGRAGYEYDHEENEDGGKDLIKIGTKMKAEGEFGFEPSLVIEMERLTPPTRKHKKGETSKIVSGCAPSLSTGHMC